MKPLHPNRTALAEPDEALLGYLQTLLDEIPEAPETAVAEEAKSAPQVAPSPVVSAAVPETRAAAVEPAPVEPALSDRIEEPFQALSFEIAGARFSLPLLDMKSIVPLGGTLTHLPGRPRWHLGVMLVRGEKVGVVDLGVLLHGTAGASGGEASPYVLMLDDGRWGLACGRLGNAFRVEPGQVRWRRNRAGPRYVRGVLKETMTPLLHSDEILAEIRGAKAIAQRAENTR
jgi:purine-binding chemotaxis protein CheW